MKIAHIITDEKFPDSAYDMFETVRPGCNHFILPGTKLPIKHLKKIDPIRVNRYSFLNRRFIAWINGFDAIVVHGMNSFSLELINRCRDGVKIYWIGMGFDYYDIIYSSKWEIVKRYTKENILEYGSAPGIKQSIIFKGMKSLKNRILYPRSGDKKRWLRRVDYFCPVLESEFFAVKEKIKNWSAEYIDWNYGNSAALVDGRYGDEFSLGNNILVGNSATLTNNHIDALRFLKKNENFLKSGSKVIVPLSYGDFSYREIVLREGVRLFDERFVPLTEMVTPKEYSEIIGSCDVVFMNHLRQQAGNNIAQALFMGARVILDIKNPLYRYYKDHGVHLSSIEEIQADPGLLTKYLTTEEKVLNRRILKKLRGSAKAIEKTEVLIKSIENP